ncbi:MAG: hypothetical protein AAGC84_04405, partial [Pseudomonas sp.]
MKTNKLILSLTLSVLAASAVTVHATDLYQQLHSPVVAESGADRTGANRVAEGGADRTGANRVAEGGADRTGANRVAEGG